MENLNDVAEVAEIVEAEIVPSVKKHSAAIKAGLTAAGGFVMGSITTLLAARAPAVQAGVRAFEAERRKRKEERAAKKQQKTSSTEEGNPPSDN